MKKKRTLKYFIDGVKMIIDNKCFDIGKRTYIMGILNVTPDSFSDGGLYNSIDKAVKHAEQMIDEGADIIDVGGESTRPGHANISEEEEILRVIPVIKALKKKFDIPISIDTSKARVAQRAVLEGASIINDVWGFKKDPDISKVAAKNNIICCLMHNRDNKDYKDLIPDMLEDLNQCIEAAILAGVKKDKIIIDPGVGFAKTYEQNLEVLKNLEVFKSLGFPVLLGTSRKSVLGNTLKLPPEERVEGTLATTVIGIMKSCDFIRVHDIKENKRVCLMTDKIIRT